MSVRHFLAAFASLVLSFCGSAALAHAEATSTPQLKEVALTFDDGPYGAPTSQILNILENEHIPATFFLIGRNVQKYPSLARREVADGDLIGNHTFDHAKNLDSSTAAVFQADLDKAEQVIASVTGVHATYFRPPYSKLSDTMREVLHKNGYTVIMWDIDTRDWDYANSPANAIVKRVLEHIKPNSIIILHDGRDTHVGYPRSNTVRALPILIADLKKQGYTFVTADKLVH